MKIKFENDYSGIALFPSVVISWRFKEIIIGWLFWGIEIEF